MRCFAHGKASAITLVHEIFTQQQKRLWIDTTENSLGTSSKCGSFPASVNIPLTPLPVLRLINRPRLSKRTPLAFWRGFSICANRSIRTWAGEHFGNMQQIFSPNPTPRLLTLRFSILARLFA